MTAFYKSIPLFVILILHGCSMLNTSIEISAEFRNGKGLESGAKVMFNGVNLGKVKSITPLENSVSVVLSIKKDNASAIQKSAAAIINTENGVFVEILNPAGSGESIAEGAMLYGLNSKLEVAAWQTGVTFGSAAQMLEQVAQSVQGYFESSEWEQSKTDLRNQLAELEKQSQQSMQGMADEIAKEIDEAVKELESRSARASENAKKHLDELEKQAQEFQNNGQADLAATLQRILEQLEAAMQDQNEQK